MQCWQYKIKIDKEKLCVKPFQTIDYKNFEILQIDYQKAKDFILEYEWVGNMGTSKYCYGLIFQNNLASVVCYGPPVSPTKYKKIFGTEVSNHILQLCRGATTFWAPKWSPSKLISTSLRILNKELGVLAVVAYSDPEAGEVGTIYQACNAHYFGMTSPGGSKIYVINGHRYDPKKVQKKFGSRSHQHIKKIDPQYYTIPIHKKHRYIFFIGNKSSREELTNKIRYLIQPYPKRDTFL